MTCSLFNLSAPEHMFVHGNQIGNWRLLSSYCGLLWVIFIIFYMLFISCIFYISMQSVTGSISLYGSLLHLLKKEMLKLGHVNLYVQESVVQYFNYDHIWMYWFWYEHFSWILCSWWKADWCLNLKMRRRVQRNAGVFTVMLSLIYSTSRRSFLYFTIMCKHISSMKVDGYFIAQLDSLNVCILTLYDSSRVYFMRSSE